MGWAVNTKLNTIVDRLILLFTVTKRRTKKFSFIDSRLYSQTESSR